ncbi:MAG TPA: glucose 1-dehydrogenase [Planctomycetaceae bacterium]|nr:glucose 1-dehydrogenase [Planctomycetaceae bacterium]
MHNRFDLSGKNAIVTGATRGIGLAIARAFAESGATVTICGRKQETVDAAIAELGAVKHQVQGVAAHVGKTEDIARLIEEAEGKFGHVNVLINNAGTNPYFGPIVDSDERAWDKTFEVNLKGPYVLSRLLAKKMMLSGGGSIVNIASVAGLQAAPLQGIYSVTKAGLIMLTKVMARECGRKGVRVNCICPGVIKTHLSETLWKDEERLKAFVANKSLGRIGDTEEIVGGAIYFASDASSFTTGSVLTIDGGMVI